MTPEQIELLVDQVTTAHRPASVDELRYAPAWHDLAPADRERAYDRTRALRALEAALDPDGQSTTTRAIVNRIKNLAR